MVMAMIGAVSLIGGSEGWTSADETTLRGDLLVGYETDVRPSAVTEVFINFQMISLNDVNIKAQEFSVSGWWILEWEDSRLTWDPASYGNVQTLQYYEDDLWSPALVISNSLTDLSAIDEDTIPLRVTAAGAVTWQPPGIFKSGCEMDTTYFPFDQQTCSMQVTSFGYTLNEVIVNTTMGVLMDFYSENGDWEVLKGWYKYDEITENGNNYGRLTFSVSIKRLNTYHWLNVILPVIVSAMLIIFVFLLPVASGEKMGYSLTCLLTYVVLLTLISAEMPTTAKHTSILGVYLTIVLIISGFTVACCIVSIHLYELSDDEKIPRFVVVTVKKIWPLVDRRKDVTKSPSQDSSKVHPEIATNYKKEATAAVGFAEKGKESRTPVRRMSLVSNSSSDMYREELIDGRVCSVVMDTFLFRVFAVFIPVFSLIFLIVLVSG